MPYIQIVTTREVSQDEKEQIRRSLGALISLIPGKSESVLMIGIMDGVSMYYGGDQNGDTAMIQVHLHGHCGMEEKKALTEKILAFMAHSLQLSPNRMFLTVTEYPNWGFQGALL